MPRTKQTARKSTPAFNLTPAVYLNPDGTVKKDRKKDRITKIRSKMARAIKMMNEAQEMLLDPDENSDVEEIQQPQV